MGDNHRVSGLLRVMSMTLVAAGAFLLLPSTANAADLSACGNIDVAANARCELVAKGPTCTAQCQPVKVQAACEAKVTLDCNATCDFDADVNCQGSCSGSCEAECNVNPPSFSCEGECEGTCSGECNGKCTGANNTAECKAACRGTCSGTCSAKCKSTPGTADCKAKCQASCSGSCEAHANLDCQIGCQKPQAYVDCRANVQGGCQAHCTDDKFEGALFCDGQYVDVGNDLKNCVDALKDALNIQVSGYAECQGNTCTAEGSASASCAAAPGETPLSGGLMAMGLGAVGIGLARRRRRS